MRESGQRENMNRRTELGLGLGLGLGSWTEGVELHTDVSY